MLKQYSFKCEMDRKRTHFLWRWCVKFGSFRYKIFVLPFMVGRLNSGHLLACRGLFCQVVKCECGSFSSRHIHVRWNHLHPDVGLVFQSSVMLSGTYGGTHLSCAPWIPELFNTDLPPHFISCILMWFSHIYGFFLSVIISLSGGGRLQRRAAELISFKRPKHVVATQGGRVSPWFHFFCLSWNIQSSFLLSPLRLQHLSLFLRGTIRRLIRLSWFVLDTLCWYCFSTGDAGGDAPQPLEPGTALI